MSLTGRQRILAVVRGEPVDRVPFAINAWHWFYCHRYHGSLPPDYADCATPIAFLQRLGADVLTRWDGQVKGRAGLGRHVRFPRCRLTREETGDPIARPAETAFNQYRERDRLRTILETPEGTLTQVWRFNPKLVADFEEEYFVKDLDRDLPALRFAALDRTYDFAMDDYRRELAELGDDGIIMLEIPENPIKMLYWMMGPQNAMIALMNQPEAFGEIFEAHTAMTLRFIDGVCERTTFDDTPLLMSNDNLDIAMMPPYWFAPYLDAHYRAVAERIHGHGRLFAVHSCGRNWGLRTHVREAGVDMLEGLTPPPVGDFRCTSRTRRSATTSSSTAAWPTRSRKCAKTRRRPSTPTAASSSARCAPPPLHLRQQLPDLPRHPHRQHPPPPRRVLARGPAGFLMILLHGFLFRGEAVYGCS